MRTHTQQYARPEYHTACKDEFRQNLRSHSWSVFYFYNIHGITYDNMQVVKYVPGTSIWLWPFVGGRGGAGGDGRGTSYIALLAVAFFFLELISYLFLCCSPPALRARAWSLDLCSALCCVSPPEIWWFFYCGRSADFFSVNS